MSDLIKAQNTPQFNWYTCWTSLGNNGMPDNLIKKTWNSLFKSRYPLRKEQRRLQVIPHPIRLDLALSTSLHTRSLISSQRFWLDFWIHRKKMVHYCLTSWVSAFRMQAWPSGPASSQSNVQTMQIVQRRTSTSVSGTTLRPLLGSPTLGTSWSAGFVRPRSLPSCQCTSSCGIKYSFSAILRVATSVEQWKCPRRKRRVNKSSLHSLRHIRISSWTWMKWCLLTRSSSLLSLSSVRQPTSHLAFLRRSPRIRSSQRKRKWLIILPQIAMNWATGNILATIIPTTIKTTNSIATIANLIIIIKTIDATIIFNATTRSQRATSPTKRRMIASAITSRKITTRPCIMTSPLCWAPATCPEEGVDLAQDLLCALILGLGLALAQAAGAMTITMWLRMIASWVQPPSAGTCTPPRVMTADVSIALTKAILFLPPSPLQQQRKSTPRNRELHQQRIYVSNCMSLFWIGN